MSVTDRERKGFLVVGFGLFPTPLPWENLMMGVSGLDACWILKEQIQTHRSQLFPVCFCVYCLEIPESLLVLS